MFSQKFSNLTNKYPNEADALWRLASYFADMEKKHGSNIRRIKLEPQRIFSISQAGSTSRFSSLIGHLISEKLIKRKISVRPSGGSGIEFESISDIPQTLRDPDRDIDIEVTSEMLTTIYIPITE